MWKRSHKVRRQVPRGRKKSEGGGKYANGFHVTGAQNGYSLAGEREPAGVVRGKENEGDSKITHAHENAMTEAWKSMTKPVSIYQPSLLYPLPLPTQQHSHASATTAESTRMRCDQTRQKQLESLFFPQFKGRESFIVTCPRASHCKIQCPARFSPQLLTSPTSHQWPPVMNPSSH